jgi:hypothetical protein
MMSRKRTRSHHPRLLPERSPDETARGRAWVCAGRYTRDQRVWLAWEGELKRRIRAARRAGDLSDFQMILASVPWPEDKS